MASSSSAINSQVDYDVFLSFRGEETRYNFTSHLYNGLCRKKIKSFIDYNIHRGEEITPFLERIIEGVRLSIIVFSSGYASSTFCLDELVKIMECRKTKGQIVLPIFYKVHPSEETYQEAIATHRANFKVEKWKSSLDEAFELAGWHIHDYDIEADFTERITRDVSEKLNYQFEGEMKITPMVGQRPKDYLKKIMQLLMNDENPKVGVWGMGGVGKTTIVTHVHNRLLNDATFSRHIYWVTVSKDSSISKLQRGIAKEIKLDLFGEDNEGKIAAKLFNALKRINKFVLILDDVWEPFETEDVGIPLMGGRKLLLTTRDLGVCQKMMCEPINVKPLSEYEAWDLFMKESKSQINDSRELREIVHSIVEECQGLPLAIVVVARTMRGVVKIWKWKNTLEELRNPCKVENNEMEKKVYKPLKFSYDRLPNDTCRKCFLYCSLFPEDYKFDKKRLINYWIGEGLLNELDSREAELNKGNAILDELIHSSLLGEHYGLVQMHDLIRDMARINVKVGLQFEDPVESVQVLDDTKLKNFPNSATHGSKLKTLVLQGFFKKEFSDCFFANIQGINVLQMRGISSIPDSITNLGNLRLLIIEHCDYLMCIPSLVGLEKLRHLEISSNDRLQELPKGIERLVNLRVLDLSFNESLYESFPSSVVEKLSHLQTLNLIGSTVEVEPEALISLEKLEILRVQFGNLHKLNCYVKSGHWQRLLDYDINYGDCRINYEDYHTILEKGMSLKAIRDIEEWKGKSGLFLPDNIQYLHLAFWESPMFYVLKNQTFAHLQRIHIYMCRSRYLFTVDLAQQLLHNVQELRIDHCDALEEIIATEEEWVDRSNYINHPTIVLPNLKILTLFYLQELRSIYRGRIVRPSLKLIRIDNCDKLERLSWDDPSAKSMYHPILDAESESKVDAKNEVNQCRQVQLFRSEGESEVDTENESESETE